MAGTKIVVMYPQSKDIEAFEKEYKEVHLPMAAEKLKGVSRFVATKVVGSPLGAPPFCRIAEIHFSSVEALQACLSSQGDRETAAHAMSISTGGAPAFFCLAKRRAWPSIQSD